MEASKLLCFLSFLAVLSAVWACPSEEIIRQVTDEDAENSGILDAWSALLNAELHFLNFVKEYGKRYSGPEEQAHRFGVFKSNLLRALEHQKMDPTAIHGVSRFSDLTEEEFRQQYLGLRPPTFLRSGAHDAPILATDDLPEDFDWREKGAPPEDFDWREKGIVTEVKDQLEELSKNLGDVGQKIRIQQKLKEIHDDPINVERRNTIKEAMLHAWTSYEKYAWGFDELQPRSRRGVNTFGGLGATIIDSLDTLYIMGLNEQFQKAKSWITSLDFNKDVDTSVFETTIRVLGGLLSAYDLSGESIFLNKAIQIADRLLPALRTPTGIPYSYINLANGHAKNPGWTGGSSVLADIGTIQVEFIALSQRTGNFTYQEKIRQIFPKDGLVPIYVNPYTRRASSKITFGAMGDSFYEYLLKVWIQGNKTEAVKQYREMWEQSMEGLTSLIKKSTPSSFTYIAELSGGSLIDKMDELACFAPGMLALGAYSIVSDKSVEYMQLAEELAWTCYNFYQSTPTKLSGDNYIFRQGQDMIVGTSWNIQRTETVESLMYLWRTTGNETYREWGWQIFKAFEAQCRVESGYVGLRDVNSGAKDDMMQSSFLAETLKYLYLLFSPPSTIPLDQWVFNNKAHPVKIMPRYGSKHEEKDSKQTSGGNEMTINIFGRKEGRP